MKSPDKTTHGSQQSCVALVLKLDHFTTPIPSFVFTLPTTMQKADLVKQMKALIVSVRALSELLNGSHR